MNKIIQIAIDGHSSTGKSTIAKQIAEKYNIVYVDTGAMYRCVTLYALKNNLIKNDNSVLKDKLIAELENIKIDLAGNKTYLNEKDVSDEIRKMEVSSKVSIISQIKEIREFLVNAQQKIGKSKSVVMDGRDIGSVVFPDAVLKLFVTAKPKVRSERRYQELLNKGENITFNEVHENLISRDEMDSKRTESPLIECVDSVLIDNSNLSNKEQMDMIYSLINNRLSLC